MRRSRNRSPTRPTHRLRPGNDLDAHVDPAAGYRPCRCGSPQFRCSTKRSDLRGLSVSHLDRKSSHCLRPRILYRLDCYRWECRSPCKGVWWSEVRESLTSFYRQPSTFPSTPKQISTPPGILKPTSTLLNFLKPTSTLLNTLKPTSTILTTRKV